jgi:hypothetical protein
MKKQMQESAIVFFSKTKEKSEKEYPGLSILQPCILLGVCRSGL